jgi:type IV secretory pathway VirB10-like protein
MIPNRFALVALGLACVTAAAGGGYLATRHNAAVQPAAAATESALAATGEPSQALVNETEAVVGDPRSQAPAAARSETREAPAPARREPTARRSSPAPRQTQAPAARTPAWPVAAPAREESASQTTSERLPASTQPSSSTPFDAAREAEPRREPERRFEELLVSANSVIGLQLDDTVSSDRANVEDDVEARVARDVLVGREVAIPAGSRALGSVMLVERGGKFKERARLGIRFHTLVLADGTRLPITSETIYRNGDAPGNASAAKIGGGAVAGAILGAIIGGGKGAAIGATAGAGGGTAAVMASDPKAATFPSGTEVTARILSPVTVTVEK